MLTETRGTIVMNSISDGYIPYQGEIPQRPTGALISDRPGTTTTYALDGLQDRGVLFVTPASRSTKAWSSASTRATTISTSTAVREKKLTNMRASSADDALRLVPFKELNLEQSIEFIAEDELVEVTPKSLRLRKKILQANRRPKAQRAARSVRVGGLPQRVSLSVRERPVRPLLGLCRYVNGEPGKPLQHAQ